MIKNSRKSKTVMTASAIEGGAVKDLFPIVGVGASAGGLEAFTQLLTHLPGDTGMAFVLVQHLDPTHPSQLASLLAKATAMPVLEIKDGMNIKRDHVYVIPPNKNLDLARGKLTLTRAARRASQIPWIISFVRSRGNMRIAPSA
jgi:two-component system CheB/CheR fusion protein